MTRDKARPGAWREMAPSQDEYYNSLFESRFEFQPSVEPETWPAIREPRPSVTLDLATGRALEAPMDRVCTSVLEAMQAALPSTEPLLALDPYHPCFWFSPQRWHQRSIDDWYLWPYPNGEYSIFVTEDMEIGIFGHPWEQTLCVFGEPLLRQLAPRLLAFLPVKRDHRQ